MSIHPYMISDDIIADSVSSVNGYTGNVILSATDVSAQPSSTVLTDIASVTMPTNSFLMTDNTGTFKPALCMPAGLAWLSYSTVDQQKAELALSTVASTGLYDDLLNKPVIAAVTKTSQLTNDSGYLTSISFPVTSVNTKTGNVSLSSSDVGASALVHNHSVADTIGLQTNLDSKVSTTSLATTLNGYVTTTLLTTSLSTKFNTPSGTTSQYVRGDGTLATLPVASSIAQTIATRALNTAFQISTTRNALVNYSVLMTVTASISGGQNGDIILEVASDSGFTTNIQTVSIAGLSQVYTLAIALQGVQGQTCTVVGVVPAGYYVRLRTVNTVGVPVFTYRNGQETLL